MILCVCMHIYTLDRIPYHIQSLQYDAMIRYIVIHHSNLTRFLNYSSNLQIYTTVGFV